MRGESNVSFEAREGPPMSHVTKRSQEGQVFKTKPDTFVIDKKQFPTSAPVDKALKRPDCTIVPKTKVTILRSLHVTMDLDPSCGKNSNKKYLYIIIH